jgi:hypothetical protein
MSLVTALFLRHGGKLLWLHNEVASEACLVFWIGLMATPNQNPGSMILVQLTYGFIDSLNYTGFQGRVCYASWHVLASPLFVF